MLNHLTINKTQIGSLSALHHLTDKSDLEAHLEAFLVSCRVDELSPRTLVDYRYKLSVFTKFCRSQGIGRLSHVSVQCIRMFLLKIQEKNQAISVSDYYKVIKRFFNWLVGEDILSSSPMARIRPPKVPQKLVVPFKPEHIETLLLACDASSKFLALRNRAIILTFLDTGLRLSELTNIQLKDIDFDREVITVMGKGAKERVVGLGKRTQKALLRYLLARTDNYPCLWVTEERRPLTVVGIVELMKVLKRRAGLEGVRCSAHTFRHTFGTWALLNGASEREVQSLLGHSSQRMVQHYTATITSEHAVQRHRHFSPVDRLKVK